MSSSILCRDIDNDQETYDDVASFEKSGRSPLVHCFQSKLRLFWNHTLTLLVFSCVCIVRYHRLEERQFARNEWGRNENKDEFLNIENKHRTHLNHLRIQINAALESVRTFEPEYELNAICTYCQCCSALNDPVLYVTTLNVPFLLQDNDVYEAIDEWVFTLVFNTKCQSSSNNGHCGDFFFVCVCLSSSVTLIFAAASYAVTSALLPQNKRKRHAGLSIHGCKCIASRKSRRALGGQWIYERKKNIALRQKWWTCLFVTKLTC